MHSFIGWCNWQLLCYTSHGWLNGMQFVFSLQLQSCGSHMAVMKCLAFRPFPSANQPTNCQLQADDSQRPATNWWQLSWLLIKCHLHVAKGAAMQMINWQPYDSIKQIAHCSPDDQQTFADMAMHISRRWRWRWRCRCTPNCWTQRLA